MRKKEFSQDEIEQILNQYIVEKKTQQAIAESFGCSRAVIKRILTEQNTVFRDRTIKYSGDYDIFENIDTPEKAYWLGFLAADGCNFSREKNASVILNIHQKDIDHLKKFKNFCNSKAEIKTYTTSAGFSNNTLMCKIVINSKKMSQDLSDKGVVPKKSLILQPPKIDKEFYLPYILGYFDGDGSISKSNQYNNYSISIQGTKELLTWIKEVLEWDAPLEQRRQTDLNEYYIRCGGTQKPYAILKKLYDSCEQHLNRKYTLYKNLETVVLSRNAK